MNEELKALMKVSEELEKLRDKYHAKAVKERAKVNDVYVTVCGIKCYSEQEIIECLEADMITAAQSDKYALKLEAKQEKAGEDKGMTASERVCQIIWNLRNNLNIEIKDIENREMERQKKEERWEIAKAQGCTYAHFLELEEISRQSEEYEENERKKRECGLC